MADLGSAWVVTGDDEEQELFAYFECSEDNNDAADAQQRGHAARLVERPSDTCAWCLAHQHAREDSHIADALEAFYDQVPMLIQASELDRIRHTQTPDDLLLLMQARGKRRTPDAKVLACHYSILAPAMRRRLAIVSPEDSRELDMITNVDVRGWLRHALRHLEIEKTPSTDYEERDGFVVL